MATADTTTDDALKRELLRLDVLLRRKQAWWEHPRNFAIILGVFAAVFGALGYKIGSVPPTPIVVQFGAQPLHVQLDH
jgi:hypothetical protein